jgi:CRP/FNR family transcriptional regulator, nitrogen fixation regulation protein
MTYVDFSKPMFVPNRKRNVGTGFASVDFPAAFGTDEVLKRALSALQRGPIHFSRNNVIACEGDPADHIFLVVSGLVRSCKSFWGGSRNIVAFYLPGDLFGVADLKYCRLSVEAASDATVLFIKRNALLSIASRECRVASFLLAITTNELRRSQEHALLMSMNAKCRLAMFLTDQWTRSGKENYLNLPMSHRDIADHLGLTIETVSRTITGMERSGLVTRVSPRRLIMRNPCALEQLIK